MVSLFAQKVRTYDSNMFYLNVKDGVLVKKSDEKKVLSILNELHGEYKPKYRKSSFNSDMRRVVGELENGIFSESKYNKPERIKKNQKGKILSVNIHSETELRSYGIIKGEARKLTKWKKGKILEVIEKVCRINDNDDSFLKHNKRRLMTLLQSIKTDLMTGMISIRICKV